MATPFVLAADGKIDELLRGLPANEEPWHIRNALGESLILFGLYRGLDDCLARLLEQTRTLPLHEAAAVGRADDVEALLKAAPWSVDLLSPDGWTALHLAAFLGRNNNVLDVLLAHGAEPHTGSKTRQPNIPLQAACAGRNIGAALLLAEVTRNVDWQSDENQQTALMIAAANGLGPVVEKLLARGADPQRQTDDGKTSIDFARENGDEAIARLLERPDTDT